MSETISVNFTHGMGDCTMFAHQIPIYQRRGYDVEVGCNPDKRIFFAATGAKLVDIQDKWPRVAWDHAPSILPSPERSLACWNKAGWNLGARPMPNLGNPEELWDEYCSVYLDIRPHIPEKVLTDVDRFLDDLIRPVILLHTIGNSFQDTKSLPKELTAQLYQEILNVSEGTIVLLDWDNRVPRLAHFRVRHLTDDWHRIDTVTFLALLDRADLIVGIDSGPFHAARYTQTPAVGVFWHPGHHPARYCMPHSDHACILPSESNSELTRRSQYSYNIIKYQEKMPSAPFIACQVARMLGGARYLGKNQRARIYSFSR